MLKSHPAPRHPPLATSFPLNPRFLLFRSINYFHPRASPTIWETPNTLRFLRFMHLKRFSLTPKPTRPLGVAPWLVPVPTHFIPRYPPANRFKSTPHPSSFYSDISPRNLCLCLCR